MKVGVILPTFRDSPDEALDTARRAEALGIHGVFCYDHLWPMGRPDRPALAPFPVLGALAGITTRIALGTLVARVGLVPPEVLVGQLATLDLLAPGRVVAGVGTGDHLSAEENLAFGIAYPPAAERLAELRHCAAELHRRGLTVWIGGRGPTTATMARELGVAANLWDAGVAEVAEKAARCEVTWAGPVPGSGGAPGAADSADPDALRALVHQLRAAGATWAVFGYPTPLEVLAAAASELPPVGGSLP